MPEGGAPYKTREAAEKAAEEKAGKVIEVEGGFAVVAADPAPSEDYFENPDYKFLVEENLNLRRKITELEQEILETKADNIKLSQQIDDQVDRLRKSGM